MLRTVYAWTIGIAYTLFWSSLGILTWPFSPRGDLYLRFARIWSRWILSSLGIRLRITGRERIDARRTYLFMANHSSIFDIFALFVAIEHPLRMVAKRVLFFIPIFGWSLWMCGFIPINRSDRNSAIASLDRAAEKIRKGISVLVFPEGTRGNGSNLLPFKKGGFVLALKAGVPVVPIVVTGTRQIMGKGSRRVGHGEIEVRFGEPIETTGLGAADRDALMSNVRGAMEELGASTVPPSSSPRRA